MDHALHVLLMRFGMVSSVSAKMASPDMMDYAAAALPTLSSFPIAISANATIISILSTISVKNVIQTVTGIRPPELVSVKLAILEHFRCVLFVTQLAPLAPPLAPTTV